MEDRLFLIHSNWAGRPEVFTRWPAVRAMRERLLSLLPADEFEWPFHGGESCEDPVEEVIERFESSIKPYHHVFDDGGSGAEAILLALTRSGVVPRSVVFNGFFALPATLRSAGFAEDATAIEVGWAVVTNPHQITGVIMQDADESERNKMAQLLDEDVDRVCLTSFINGLGRKRPFENVQPIDCPALYLDLAVAVPGAGHNEDVLRRYLPRLQVDSLSLYGLRLQEEAGGHEVADKAIPFMEGIIKGREGP
jgi:hypothetical protein